MAIEQPLRTEAFDFDVIDGDLMTFTEEGMDGSNLDISVLDDETGGVEVVFGEESEGAEVEFGANLAEHIEETELRSIALDLIEKFESDKRSRADWETTYRKGIDLLGLKIEERMEPWPGASGVFHPMLAEAVVRFQSQTIGEIFPPKGPVKVQMVGKWSEEKDKQARRVQDHMNYVILHEMTEYRRETERLLWSLPVAGSAFRKTYLHPVKNRPESMFVPAEDLVVNYADATLEDASRITHISKVTHTDLLKTQASGWWTYVDVPEPSPETDALKEAKDKLQGTTSAELSVDVRHTILEVHTDLDLPGFEDEVPVPYVVTIDKSSATVLAIRRNWDELDPTQSRLQHFVHYEYIPAFGFYAMGLTHLIGSLAKGSTSILRQLIDSGSLANLPGGLKTRGLRVKGDETPIQPGEFRDVDVPSGTIRDNITFLPYKEPSATLLQLLNGIVEDGRRFASMADMKVADMNQEAPVGTTLAIMERALKVQTAVQQRIHDSLKKEFKILARVIRDMGPSYPYETEADEGIAESDYDDRVDIIPVSDPNASTFSQRIMQYQATLQLASGAPQMYDLKVLHRQMIDALGVPNAERIIPLDEEVRPADPVEENMKMMNLRPVRAAEYQDHEAHLRVHRAFQQDPSIAQSFQNSPTGSAVGAALDAHIREHMAYLYRREIERELGAAMPPENEVVPEDVEKRLSATLADAAEQMLGKKQAMAQAEAQAAQQQDPIIQMKMQELQLRQSEVQAKIQAEQERISMEKQRLQLTQATEAAKIQQKDADSKLDAQVDLAAVEQRREEARLKAETDRVYHDSKNTLEGIRLGVDIAKESMNDGLSGPAPRKGS